MKIVVTKYGWPQVFLFPAVIISAMLLCLAFANRGLSVLAVALTETVLLIVLLWVLFFFRDPHRVVPVDTDVLLSPADGRITDIETVEQSDFINGPAVRMGIFLSIFDVHINRAPCDVKVENITYKKGSYKNAMSPYSGQVNESNQLALTRINGPRDKLIVRQISGAIARRIVCEAKEGQQLAGGEKFGMIKFGSRTELYIPTRDDIMCLVKTGDKVKAGITPLARYQICQD